MPIRTSDPSVRRTRNVIVVLGLCLLVSLLVLSNFVWKTVSQEEQTYPYGVVKNYGYKIEKPWGWRHAFRIVLYGNTVSVKLDGPMKFQRVLERQWLCDNRVLYLSVQALHTYSGGISEFTSKVVYDFERNEMHTSYSRHLGGVASGTQRRPAH